MQDLVSIIIPNYNSIKYIDETLNCLLNQTHKSLEIIVIDDASTDGSYQHLLSKCENRLKVVANQGKGACAARNLGLELAAGDYIQFIDADDLVSLDKIERQLEILQGHKDKVAVCSTSHFYQSIQDGLITDRPFMFSTEKPEEFLLRLYGGDGNSHNMVAISAWLTPLEIIRKAGKWDETLTKDQDGEYFCRVVMASSGIVYEPLVTNYYRKYVYGNNISSGTEKKHLLSQLKSIQSKQRQLVKFAGTRNYRNAFAMQYKILAINAYPQFFDIYRVAYSQYNALGRLKYSPVLGGKIVEIIKFFCGWRAAKTVSYYVHKIL